MTKGRKTRPVTKDGRRCSECRKVAKDKINGEYYCRIHSPAREGFKKRQELKGKK